MFLTHLKKYLANANISIGCGSFPGARRRHEKEKMHLSLSGCGSLIGYHTGFCKCIKDFCPELFSRQIVGTSSGSLVAVFFLCEIPIKSCTMSVINVVLQVRHGILGPITPDLDIMSLLYENMACILPENAHTYCNGKLHISVTRYEDCQNVLLSHFESKEELLQALMCSCFIPVYCGFEPPKFHGVAYVDGGYSNNCPRLNEHTVTVAPFFGNTDVCPRDKTGDFRTLMLNGTSIFLTMENCRRLLRVLFPGPPNMMKELCQRGYNDALLFLRDNDLIPCPDCSSEINGNRMMENKDHSNCKPVEYPIPLEICDEIDAAVQRLHQGLGQRLLRNPIVRILYYVNMPSIFTAKISYSFFSAIARKLQNKASACIENGVSNSVKTTSKMMYDMEEGNLDVSANEEKHRKSVPDDNLQMELQIKSQERNPFFPDANDILQMTLGKNNPVNKSYSTCNDIFHVTSVPSQNHALENSDNYFIVKHCPTTISEKA